MKHSFRIFTAALAGMSLAACASSSSKSLLKPSGANKTDSSQSARGVKNINPRLSARTLARDECGLFVWSADDERRFILFSQAQEQAAIWADANAERVLTLTDVSGQEFQQQFTRQNFIENVDEAIGNAMPARLRLSLLKVEELPDSTRFKAGTLSQIMDDGTEMIIPIVALSTCRS